MFGFGFRANLKLGRVQWTQERAGKKGGEDYVREAYGVRWSLLVAPALWGTDTPQKRQQAERTPYASRSLVAAVPG
jgi:hypothetical protein